MSRLSEFMHRDCAEACSAAKHGRDSSNEFHPSPVRPALMPLRPAHRTSDYTPLVHTIT